MLGAKRICRVRIAKEELEKMSKEDFHKSWLLQEQYVEYIEAKLNKNADQVDQPPLPEPEDKLRQQYLDSTRRENILVMRLTTKEQETQEYVGQIQELKQAQIPSVSQLRSALLDPAVNLMFEKMRKEIDSLKSRLEETQNELTAWKFTPDSNTGKRLMAKCRLLHQENEELGKTLSSGRFAKLESDLALQKNFSEEMKKSQSELDEFVMELDEDVEGMQSTIYYLQQQLRESKDQILKLQKENEKFCGLSRNSPINNLIVRDEPRDLSNDKSSNLVVEVRNNNALSPDIMSTKSPPSSVEINRTEISSSPINSATTWSSPPSSIPASNENSRTEKSPMLTIKVEPHESLSPKEPSPQSKSKKLDHAATNSVLTARGSLHMEEYDSEQDEAMKDECKSNALVKLTNASRKRKNIAESVNKRTSENGGRGRKRTRGSTRSQTVVDDESPSELPVKRLRHRNVVVEKDILDKVEQKRTPLDHDQEAVQVAHTLAQWAATNKERKGLSNRDLTEALGNGEHKGTVVCNSIN